MKKLAELMRKAGMEQYLKDGKILRYGYVRDPELQEDRSAVAFNYALDRNPRLKKSARICCTKKTICALPQSRTMSASW